MSFLASEIIQRAIRQAQAKREIEQKGGLAGGYRQRKRGGQVRSREGVKRLVTQGD